MNETPARPAFTQASRDRLTQPQATVRPGQLRLAARVCATIAATVAGSVLLGWYAGIPAMVRLGPGIVVVQYNTALCIALGAASLTALVDRRERLSLVLALSLALLAGVTFIEYLTGWSAGVDEMLWWLGVNRDLARALLDAGALPRMSPNAALSLAVIGAGLLAVAAGRMNRARLVVGSFCALAATTISAVALFGYVLGIPTAYGWRNFTAIAPQSAAAIIVLGLGVLCGTVLAARHAGVPTGRVVPGLAGSTVAIAGLLLWEAQVDHDRRDLHLATRHQAIAGARSVARGVEARVAMADHLMEAHASSAAPGARQAAVAQVLHDFPGVSAISWLDASGIVTSCTSREGRCSASAGSSFASTPARAALLRESRRRGRAVVSHAAAHVGRDPSVFVTVPARRDAPAQDGYLVVELVPARLLGEVLADAFAPLYGYALRDGRTVLASHATPDDTANLRWAETVPIDVRGQRWSLTITPTARTLAEYASWVPTTFLVAAMLCALVAGWTVRAAQVAAEQARQLERTVADLATENEARQAAELLRDENADMLGVQSAEIELQYRELQVTATELADQRDELWRAQEFSTALVRSTVDAVASFDPDGRVHAWNPAMAALTGRGHDDVSGALVGHLLPFLAYGEEVRLLQEALAGRATTLPALHATHRESRDGVWLDLTVTPMRSADGEVVGGLLVARDITEKQRVAEVILASRDAAEQSNRAKSDFLARMSHELRTPLNAVIGFTNVIRRNANNHLARTDLTYLERISANGKHLLALIDTVLDLSKIESGHETVALAATPVSTLVRDTIAELEVRAMEAGVQLHASTPWGAEAVTDQAKLKQVLINLLGNAIKFTPRDGSVFVRVETDPFSGAVMRIDVEDTGIGIPADRHHAIFEAFEQADAQTAHTYGGTGLGLAISRKLCVLMGHELVVESAPGKGSRFSVLFRSPPVAAAA